MRIVLLLLLYLPGYNLQKIFLATRTGVDQIIVNNNSSKEVKFVNFNPDRPPSTPYEKEYALYGASAVHFDKANHDIYLISGKEVIRLQYDLVSGKLGNGSRVLRASSLLTDLAVDWEKKIAYVTITATNQLVEVYLMNSTLKPVPMRFHNVTSLALDPYTRRLFYIDGSKQLMQYDLVERAADDVLVKSGFPLELTEILQIVVDVPKETLYAILTYMVGGTTNHRCLIRIDYKIFEYKCVYEGPELSNVVGLDAFNDEVVWANHLNHSYKLYKGQVSQEGMLENVTFIHETTNQEIRDIKIDHPDSQKPSILNMCTMVNCSHACEGRKSMKYSQGVVCTCPEGMMLDADGRTCTVKPTDTPSIAPRADPNEETYLLATDTGIEELIVTDNGSTTSTVVNLTQGATSIDFHRAGNEIYIISGKEIFRASYYPPIMEPSVPTKLPTTCQSPWDLVFDWEKGDIRFRCTDPSALIKINVFASNLTTTNSKANATNLSAFRMDPYSKTIFFILDSKRLMRYVIEQPYAAELSFKIALPHEISQIHTLAVDVPKQNVYIIITYMDGGTEWCLIRLNYETFDFSVAATGHNMTNTVDLDVFNDEVVWGTNHNLTYTLYRGRMSSEGLLENVTVIHKTEQEIRDVRIFHRDAQTPSTLNLCAKLNCSNSCTGVNKSISPHGVLCTCPIDMLLDADGRTCKGHGTDLPVPTPTMKTSGQLKKKHPPIHMNSSGTLVPSVVCDLMLLILLAYYNRNSVM